MSKICICKKNCNINNPIEQEYKSIEEIKITKEYENAIIEGGALKGIAYLGVLEELEKYNIKFKRIAGSSMGAIAGTLLALDYSPQELKKEMLKINFRKMMDDKIGIIRDIYNLFNKYGVCSGKRVMKLMGNLINKKTGNPDYTFEQLYEEKGITLVITGCNLNKHETVYYSYLTHPNLPIRNAIRISMSIPFIYKPVKCPVHKNEYFVDGGVTDIYPIHVFDGSYPGSLDAINGHLKPNPKTLGFKLLTQNESVDQNNIKYQTNINNIKNFCSSVINTFCASSERRYIREGYWERSVIISVPNIPITKFNLNQQEIDKLLECGRQSVIKFFSTYNDPYSPQNNL